MLTFRITIVNHNTSDSNQILRMRIGLRIIVASAISLLACKGKDTYGLQPKEIIQVDWTEKRGYILRDEGLELLEKLELKEITRSIKNAIGKSDTIGKYLRSSENKHYLFCIWDPQFEEADTAAHFLVEIAPMQDQKFEVLAKERYQHGTTVGCWENKYSGFNMHYDYFSFQTCRGKQGYSAVNHYYFTYVRKQDEIQSIPDKFAVSTEKEARLLASKKSYKKRGILYNYRYEVFNWQQGNKIMEKELDSFSIYYDLDGTLWTPSTDLYNHKFK